MQQLIKRSKAHRGAAISRTTAWRLERTDPTFPVAVQLGPNNWAYYEAEWQAWIDARPRRRVTKTAA